MPLPGGCASAPEGATVGETVDEVLSRGKHRLIIVGELARGSRARKHDR